MKDNNFKLKEDRFRLDLGKKFFIRMVRLWTRLSREAVDSPSLKLFMTKLEGP